MRRLVARIVFIVSAPSAVFAAGLPEPHLGTAPSSEVEHRQDAPQNLDFENGLRGWTASGTAFDAQPVAGAGIKSDGDRLAPGVGGDYWRGLPYPLGHQGDHLVSSDDIGRGELVSSEFVIVESERYFSFLIGGLDDAERVRFELQVRGDTAADTRELERHILSWQVSRGWKPAEASVSWNESFLVLQAATGHGVEALRQEVWELPAFLRGHHGRIRIVDDSDQPGGHINVDFIRLSRERPSEHLVSEVWGFADYHTHPMAHLGFGGLSGISTLWGDPGGNYEDYVNDDERITRDIPACIPRHGQDAGPSAEPFINTAEHRFRKHDDWRDLWSLITGRITRHKRHGAPDYRNFPTFLSGAHQQMHVTQIRRAWQGGLRLMTAIAVHNRGLEYFVSKVRNGRIDPSTELEVVIAQVCAMQRLAHLNDWMRIAYSSDEARRIIQSGKLAVVLGVEVDQLGELDKHLSFAEEVELLWDLGIRQVTPIHAIDNRLGGAAVFEDVYNSVNDLVHRGNMNLRPQDLDAWPAKFFDVRDRSDCSANDDELGDRVLFRLEKKSRVVLRRTPYSPFRITPDMKEIAAYDEGPLGHTNAKGLTPCGRRYIDLLIQRGILVDIAHMSQRSVDDAFATVGEQLEREGRPECARLGTDPDLPPSCYADAPPLVASHAHFRRLSYQRRKDTTVEGFLPSEYELSDHVTTIVSELNGIVGPFVSEGPVHPPNTLELPFANDCAMSSKSFGVSWLYGQKLMNRTGVGLATDFAFIPSVAPRFGPNACWAYKLADNAKKEREKSPGMYLTDEQRDGVVYQRCPKDPRVTYGENEPLVPYQMGSRTYDFNVDGLAHYGLLPDLLQDIRNLGMEASDFASLFGSAEAFLRTWKEAERHQEPVRAID